jgi:hypothetical protein
VVENGTDKQESLAAEELFIQALRKEAGELKDCFTRYSFQAMSIAVGALIIIVRFQFEHPLVGLACILPILLLLSVCSMGTHKYAAVNRLLGYELHMQRTRALKPYKTEYWASEWRTIGWEEAMRAWRVVAPTLIDRICIIPPKSRLGARRWRQQWWKYLIWRVVPDRVRRRVKNDWEHGGLRADADTIELPAANRWFEPSSLIPDGASYYAGGYLQTMLNGIYAVIWVALANLLFVPYIVALQADQDSADIRVQSTVAWLLFWTTLVFFLGRMRHLNARRRLLESGVLSIHSCAILWQASIAAHFRSLKRLVGADNTVHSYDGYTKGLGDEAIAYLPHLGHINKLLDGQDSCGV